MKYYTFPAGDKLKDFVSHFWISEFEGIASETFTYFSTADSCTKAVFIFKKSNSLNSSDLELFSSGVQGQTHKHGRFPTVGNFKIFGINLYPHSIPYLFSLPTRELNNEIVEIETLLGKIGKELNDKIATARNDFDRIALLKNFIELQLYNNFNNYSSIIPAIQWMRAKKGLVNIKQIADQFCLSQKQFERKFKEYAGFTPKLYARIIRFENVLYNYKNVNTLTQAAFQFGYYDQSHFIKDFKEFTGFRPTEYFSIAG